MCHDCYHRTILETIEQTTHERLIGARPLVTPPGEAQPAARELGAELFDQASAWLIDVTGFGGTVKQYQILVDTRLTKRDRVTINQIEDAINIPNANVLVSFMIARSLFPKPTHPRNRPISLYDTLTLVTALGSLT
jgi:hypothetical protein